MVGQIYREFLNVSRFQVTLKSNDLEDHFASFLQLSKSFHSSLLQDHFKIFSRLFIRTVSKFYQRVSNVISDFSDHFRIISRFPFASRSLQHFLKIVSKSFKCYSKSYFHFTIISLLRFLKSFRGFPTRFRNPAAISSRHCSKYIEHRILLYFERNVR